MSSIVGHTLAGAATYLALKPLSDPAMRWGLPVMVLLAIVPDFDYGAYWFLSVHAELRVTHSLVFCCVAAVIAWFATAGMRRRTVPHLGFWPYLVASLSHLVLDFWVGAHGLPLFWPFTAAEITAPIGLLPSAGALVPGNFYLWRNLAIECGVLIPILAAIVVWCRGVAWGRVWLPGLGLAAVEASFLAWSILIHG